MFNVPFQNILLNWRRHYWSWRAKYRSMFGTFSLWARRGLSHGASRDLNFCCLIQTTSPCSRLVRQARDTIKFLQFKPIFLQFLNQRDLKSLYFLGCTDSPYNSNTTDSDTAAVQHYVVDKTITLTCKRNHRLVSGNQTRVCLENGLWSGKEPVCKSEVL